MSIFTHTVPGNCYAACIRRRSYDMNYHELNRRQCQPQTVIGQSLKVCRFTGVTRVMVRLPTVAVATVLMLGLVALGDDTTSKDAEAKERLEVMKQQASAYEVILKTSPPTKLDLHSEPLLRFSNPVGGVPDGIVVMWKEGNRPAIFAQVFQTKEGLWVHECQSLASAELTMKLGTATKWSPDMAAADFRQVAGAPAAADSATKRLLQMKALAAKFSAVDDFKI